jgi:hypothetical protein
MANPLTNTFTSGLVSDTSVLVQPNDSIRNSMGGTLMDVGSGLYQWKPLKGNTSILRFPETYYPVAYWSFLNELIFWLASDTKAGMIASVTFDEEWTATFKSIYANSEFTFNRDNPLVVFGYEENENIKRVYFSDRQTDPYVLNIKEYVQIFSVETDLSNLIPYNWYVVETGYVEVYDFENMLLHTYINGESFCYDPYTGTYLASGTTTVRQSSPLEKLKWNPNASFLKMATIGFIAGNLLYGNYKIGYRYGTYSGFLSPIVLVDTYTVTKQISASNNPDLYQGTSGDSHLLNSSLGIQFQLTEYDHTFDFIEMIAIHAVASDLYENGTVFNTYDIPKDGSEIIVNFINYSAGSISVNEVMLNPIPIKAIQDFTTIKKHCVITNFKERKELPLLQKMDCDIVAEIYPLLTDISGLPTWEDDTHAALSWTKEAGPTTTVYKNQWYKVVGTSVSHGGFTYTTGQIFKGLSRTTVGANIVPVFVRKTHFDWDNATQKYEIQELGSWYDYKDPVLASQASGFFGGSKERLGILFYDKKMIPYFGRFLDEFQTPNRNMSEQDNDGEALSLLQQLTPDYLSYSINVLSLVLSNIDITDVIDEIGGFAICRVPQDSNIVSEGWLEAIKYIDDDSKDYHERYPFLSFPDSDNGSCNYKRRNNWYFYVSPEFLFKNETEIKKGDYLKITRYQQGSRVSLSHSPVTANPYGMITHTACRLYPSNTVNLNWGHVYEKVYKEITPMGALPIGEINNILKNIKIDIDKKTEIKFDSSQPGYFFKNVASRINWGYYPVGGKGILLQTERDETGIDLSTSIGFGSYDNPDPFGVTVVQQVRNEVVYGNTKYDLEKLELVQITPIQRITETFKTEIYKSSIQKYIVSNLQVFGGSCYVNVFDHIRVMQDVYERYKLDGIDIGQVSHSHTVFIPLQSKFNIAFRKGKHIASVRSFDNTYQEYSGDTHETNPGGIAYNSVLTGETGMPAMWEQFLYDDSYHNLGNSFRYPMLFANYVDQENFFTRARWSTQKVIGESIDSFRNYLVNNFIDLDSRYGPIINIDGSSDKLFYWQKNSVGYIPVSERELVPSGMGAPIQLGIGGMMERSDNLDTFHGNQHGFGLLRIPTGFIWLDYLRKDMLYLSFGGQLKNISKDGYFSNWIKQGIPSILMNDNPFAQTGGISCGYDPETKLAYFTFLKTVSDEQVTIAIHTDTFKLMGEFQFFPPMYILANNAKLLTFSNTQNEDLITITGKALTLLNTSFPDNESYIWLTFDKTTEFNTPGTVRKMYFSVINPPYGQTTIDSIFVEIISDSEVILDIQNNLYDIKLLNNKIYIIEKTIPIADLWFYPAEAPSAHYENDCWSEENIINETFPLVSTEDALKYNFLYIHNTNDNGFFYEKYNDAWVDIVITTKNINVKFDVLHFVCGTTFFDQIEYFYTYDATDNDKFIRNITEATTDTRYYKKFGDKWKAEIPIGIEGRLSGIAMMIRCVLKQTSTNQKEIALQEIQTFVREYKL